MAAAQRLADALLNSEEATRLNIEIAELRNERNRLRQRVADLQQANEDLSKAEAALALKIKEGALLIEAIQSSMVM
jgi:FtsZ-binding cell division protein ZapB